jgi:hypothetical protein
MRSLLLLWIQTLAEQAGTHQSRNKFGNRHLSTPSGATFETDAIATLLSGAATIIAYQDPFEPGPTTAAARAGLLILCEPAILF